MAAKDDDLDFDDLDSGTELELDDDDITDGDEGDVAEPDPVEDEAEEDPQEEDPEEENSEPTPDEDDPRIAALEAQKAELEAQLQTERERRELADRAGLETLSEGLDRDIAAVRAQLKQAKEDGDIEKDLELTEKMADLKAEQLQTKQRLQSVGKEPEAKDRPEAKEKTLPAAQAQAITVLANEWKTRNPWFNNAQYAAEADYVSVLYNRMVNEGLNPTTKAFYLEADKRLAKVFPRLYPKAKQPVTNKTKSPAAPVANSAPQRKKANVYQLTAIDKEFIAQMGKSHDAAYKKRYAEEQVKARNGKR